MTDSSRGRRLLALVTTLIMVSALVAGPAAEADGVKNQDAIPWHEPIPNVPVPTQSKANCTITGLVDFVASKKGHGVGTKPAHGFYQAVATATCVGVGIDNLHYSGVYEIDAQGATDGLALDVEHEVGKIVAGGDPFDKPKDDPSSTDKKKDHGEDLEQGWSHSAGYCKLEPAAPNTQPADQNVNKGDLAVVKVFGEPIAQSALPCKTFKGHVGTSDPHFASWIKFVRGWNQALGTNHRTIDGEWVIAWGLLQWDDDKKPFDGNRDCFRADLALKPISIGEKDGGFVIAQAIIEGAAVVYNVRTALDAKTLVPTVDECDNQKKDVFKKEASPSSPKGGAGSRGPRQ